MLARCPDCATVFRVAPADLRAARGLVRCGVCFGVFDAVEVLEDGVRASAPVAAAGTKTGPDEGLRARAAVESRAEQIRAARGASPAEASPLKSTEPLAGPVRSFSGVEAHGGAPALTAHSILLASERPRRHAAGWVALVVSLLSTLLAQIAWFRGTELLAAYPALQEPLAALCTLAGCRLPSARDPGAIQVRERSLRIHPRYRDALSVDAILVNEAAFEQPYPLLELRFYDTDGAVVAGRRFEPREYLDPALDPDALMPAGQPLHVLLELFAPNLLPASYEIRFF